VNTCWSVPYGPPGTFCQCGHVVEMHLRLPHHLGNTVAAARCVECLGQAVDRLEAFEMYVRAQHPVKLEDLTAEQRDQLELLALRRLLEAEQTSD
jgi:hypothetical protein